LLVFLCDFPTKVISLGPEVSKLCLDSHVRGERRSRWSVIFSSWRVGGILVKRVGEVAVGIARLGWAATGEGPVSWQPWQSVQKRVGTLAPVTARCEVGFVGLLRGGSTRARADPSVPRPEQTRKCERKLGKNEENPVREKLVNGGCARLIGPRTVTTSSRERVRVVRNPLNVMARLSEVVGRNGTSRKCPVRTGML
ncbi:hypothetical protein CRG98_009638, partial [Punica granatum]